MEAPGERLEADQTEPEDRGQRKTCSHCERRVPALSDPGWCVAGGTLEQQRRLEDFCRPYRRLHDKSDPRGKAEHQLDQSKCGIRRGGIVLCKESAEGRR